MIIRATVTQRGGAVANGRWNGRCTAERKHWKLTAFAEAGVRFDRGNFRRRVALPPKRDSYEPARDLIAEDAPKGGRSLARPLTRRTSGSSAYQSITVTRA